MQKMTPEIHKANLEKIKNLFPEAIQSWKCFEDGFDNFAYEINSNWIFKIPRRSEVWEMLKREKAFLDVFFKRSPLQIPIFEFFGDRVLGYKKIDGEKLTAELLDSLNDQERKTVAKQIGEFLSSLHNTPFETTHVSGYRNFFNKEGFDKLIEKIHELVAPRLSVTARKNVLSFLLEVQNNENNFHHIQSIIHSDLYYSHIYWDKDEKKISGIIDFGEISNNAITSDFTMLANFTTHKNDSFLKDLLLAYDSDDNDLFRKIKVFSKIEKLYWPIDDIESSKIQPDKLKDLEASLNKIEQIFT